jgi:hypothetical protein
MLEPGGETDLPMKPLGSRQRSQLGQNDFEGHRPVVLEIASQVDRCHTASAQLTLQGVAVGECGGKLGRDIGHSAA